MLFKINNTKFLHESHPQELDDAPDKPPTLLLTIVIIISFLFVFFVVAVSYPIIEKLSDSSSNKVDMGMGNTERIVYISGQKQILSSYKKINEKQYQIPIQQAMDIVVNNQGDISALNRNVDVDKNQ